MTAIRSPNLRAGAPAVAPRRLARLGRALAAVGFGATLAAQAATVPPGWSCATSFVETAQPLLVRSALVLNAKEHLVAVRQQLFRTGAQRVATMRPLLDLGSNDDIAFLVPVAGGRCAVGALRSGKVLLVDPVAGHVGTFAGVPNAFDAAALGADLLVTANPMWPQAGAHSGVWLVGPGRLPREVLALVGPSAPLAVRANGDLVVGELGPTVPPPPGAIRLLQIPANRVSAALAGAALSMADVTAIGTGYTGLFDLAVDDQGRLHATDPTSSVVVHTAPGGLSPVGTTLDVGPGRFALTLHYQPHGSAPFRGFQPADAAPALGVGTSDFATRYEWRQLRSARPHATVPTGTRVPVGPFSVDVTGAPPLGLGFAFASLPGSGPETLVATVNGTPLWLALPLATTFLVADTALDAAGAANFALWNPGSAPGRVDLQVVAMDALGAGDVGSAAVIRLDLLP